MTCSCGTSGSRLIARVRAAETARWSSSTASFSRQALDAYGDELAAVPVRNFQRFPVLNRQLHRFCNVRGGHDRRRGQEPTGAPDTDQVGTRTVLRLIEMPHDADGRVLELGGIDAR